MFAKTTIMIASKTIKEVGLRVDANHDSSNTIKEVNVRIDANHDSFKN